MHLYYVVVADVVVSLHFTLKSCLRCMLNDKVHMPLVMKHMSTVNKCCIINNTILIIFYNENINALEFVV